MGKAKDRIEAMIRFHKNRYEDCSNVSSFEDDGLRDIETYRRMVELEAQYHLNMIDILEGYDPGGEDTVEEVVTCTQLSPTGIKGKKPKPRVLDNPPK